MKDVVIAGAARTPMGGFQGVFANVDAPTLGGVAIKAALLDAGEPTVDEVLMGCVLPAGLGQAPARQASFLGGLSDAVPATTLNKMCGLPKILTIDAHPELIRIGIKAHAPRVAQSVSPDLAARP